MFVVRPVQIDDLERLLVLAGLTSFGLTTLPKDRNLLEKRIKRSLKSFRNLDGDDPTGESYLFVIEDFDSHEVMGTCGIVSKTGGFEPFYSYQIQTSTHESQTLGIRKEIAVLHLVENHDGPSEIGSLFLHPDARGEGNGRALSLSRFLFMAEYSQMFDPDVVAEMRGVINEQGRSPFWDALGKKFFDLEFPKADYLSIVNKEFIGDLMPRFPIYIPLLPAEAQAVIGEVHELTKPARRLLESEGFRFENQVDIFEAGPLLHCPLKKIRSVRESQVGRVIEIVPVSSQQSIECLIASRTDGFRATRGSLELTSQGVKIDARIAESLGVSVGDPLRYILFRSEHHQVR
ncbi:arginine N-succinyltransferase [Planctomicrobium sp. SH668]|uniref:arginine N-succinyltransferase n=1 Tax=Planctomicrobium sp. SH668 TaxID=3448126 RepID=UPI003F5C79E9